MPRLLRVRVPWRHGLPGGNLKAHCSGRGGGTGGLHAVARSTTRCICSNHHAAQWGRRWRRPTRGKRWLLSNSSSIWCRGIMAGLSLFLHTSLQGRVRHRLSPPEVFSGRARPHDRLCAEVAHVRSQDVSPLCLSTLRRAHRVSRLHRGWRDALPALQPGNAVARGACVCGQVGTTDCHAEATRSAATRSAGTSNDCGGASFSKTNRKQTQAGRVVRRGRGSCCVAGGAGCCGRAGPQRREEGEAISRGRR